MNNKVINEQDERFLQALRKINESVHVDPQTLDVLEAYARLRIDGGREIDFSGTNETPNHQAFRELLNKNQQLDKPAIDFLAAYFLETRRKGIVFVLNPSHLASLLGQPLDQLHVLANQADHSYQSYFIKKRNGGEREILAPYSQLKQTQRKILDALLHSVPLNAHAEGFRRARSVASNAARHTGKRILVKLDVTDFFPSITSKRVFGVFQHLGYPASVSHLLTRLTTHKGRLPIGAPTSPTITNIMCRRLDSRMAKLGERMDFDYSRYADDLSFSSNHDKFPALLPLLKEIVEDEGFAVNEKKVRITRNNKRQEVTGVVVNEEMSVSRQERRKLRAMLFNCQRNGMRAEARQWANRENRFDISDTEIVRRFRRSLLAKIHYVRMINTRQGDQLLRQFEQLA